MKKIALSLALLLGLAASHIYAQESKYQALYLFNFTKYIDWPGEQVTIGVIGNSPVLIELESLAKNSKVKLLKIAGSESVSSCDMIFLPEAQSRNFDLIQSKLNGSPIILVTENESLVSKGAEMGFYTENNKLRFAINKGELDATGMKVSNTLFGQARIVN